MLEFLISVLALVVTLGILVTIHEFGHFWVARLCGVKVLRFSIGFGKAAKSWVGKDGVEYVIAPIPLGGYVKMLGQDDLAVTEYGAAAERQSTPQTEAASAGMGDQAYLAESATPGDFTGSGGHSKTASGGSGGITADERSRSFAYKPLWQRMAIVAAGPLANFLLAIVVYWIVNIGYGINGVAPVISGVMDDSPAALAGLRSGDEILAVDGKETFIWQQVTLQLLSRMGETGTLEFTIDPANSSTTRNIEIPISAWLGHETEPNPVSSLGIIQIQIPARIADIIPGSRAEAAGLQSGDEILTVDGQQIHGWTHWVEVIRANPELPLDVTVQRGDEIVSLLIRPELAELADGSIIGQIGAYVQDVTYAELVPPELQREVRYGVFSALQPALRETWDKSIFVLDSVKKMIVGLISVKNINGPITIAQVAGETASYGLDVYLGFLALLSISLGVLNLLPVPVLDGGHLLYYSIEAVIRRPVPERIQAWGLQLGLLLISGVMVLAIYNDVSRLL